MNIDRLTFDVAHFTDCCLAASFLARPKRSLLGGAEGRGSGNSLAFLLARNLRQKEVWISDHCMPNCPERIVTPLRPTLPSAGRPFLSFNFQQTSGNGSLASPSSFVVGFENPQANVCAKGSSFNPAVSGVISRAPTGAI